MSSAPNTRGRFGTFGGVFTPSVLTILGVIMFMRAGFVVGNEGIWYALAILAISKGITGLTTMSLSAIATNTEVGPGGNYFMISRSLGPDVGGAVGLTLFVSQAVAIAFYVIGFTEALFGLIGPHLPADILVTYKVEQIVSSVTIALLFLLSFKGAEAALRAQYAIFAVLMLSVASFLIGGALAFDSEQFSANTAPMVESVGFWAAFAIFFPAATGIDAGANMSGDLKDPARSIPLGTVLAILFTALVYVALLILMAGFTTAERLSAQPFEMMQEMSIFAPLIIAGVFAATLSSALASFLGAPRILQAMGKDKLLKWLVFFAKGHGDADEPRRATVLSFVIALGVVWAGDLNAVAEVISMFFLIAYGMINVSAFVEGRSGNPSFRPRFKIFGWPAAITGAVACGVAMLKINETYAIVATVIAGGIYASLRGRVASAWGDAKAGYMFARTRDNLFALAQAPTHPKNWRPLVAAITPDATKDKQMLQCAAWLESERGLLSVIEVVAMPERDHDERSEIARQRTVALRQTLHRRRIKAFADSFVLPSDATEAVVQSYSQGSLRPNTIMLTVPPPSQVERRQWLAEALRGLAPLGRNVIVYKGARMDAPMRRRIDLWWAGQRNGSLMALFTYLIMTHPAWKSVEVKLIRIVKPGGGKLEAEQSMAALCEAARLDMKIEVILSQQPVFDIIAERSATADLVILGLQRESLADFDSYLAAQDEFLARLPPTLLVLSNGEVDLLS